VGFDAHTLLFASLAILCGYQSIQFAVFSKAFAIGAGLLPEAPRLTTLLTRITLERGLVLGLLGLVIGMGLLLAPTGLCSNDALGHPGCDPDRAERPDDHRQLPHQRPEHGSSLAAGRVAPGPSAGLR
jgi:hypothetical protein